ncbi:3041_t:CDS:2 [Diversispora eburnea]|uniref:3041_t:CDS:1 n=1 Tax=Diversispora eburnea TaxID=1213867 RepID=A0A9N8YNW6_9GLOM|nr:3041_t:CDS:2 [Diversispora eburnea]
METSPSIVSNITAPHAPVEVRSSSILQGNNNMDIDYVYAPFDRPPSRLGRRTVPTTKQHKNSRKISNKRRSSYISIERLKVDNSFLKNQNLKLSLELEHSRITIQALKNIVNQKDMTLQNFRNENQSAILKIRVLETFILSKHAKDGSIIVRSNNGGWIKPKRQRRWSIDFGPRNHLSLDDDVDTTLSTSSRRSPTSTICTNEQRSTESSRGGMLKRKTGDIIQSLASCRPTSTKIGYDSDSGISGEESDPEVEDYEDINEQVINEKLQKQRKLGKRFLRIFSSSLTNNTLTINQTPTTMTTSVTRNSQSRQ